MAKLIKIIKFNETKDSIVYRVFNYDNIIDSYYMNIIPTEQKIDFYSDKELKSLVISIDLNNLDQELENSINRSIILPAFAKGYEAFKKNEYPNDISFCA